MRLLTHRGLWLSLGLIAGLSLTWLLPEKAVQATATQGEEGIIMATGEVDAGLEGVYVLDSLTGELSGAVLNINTRTFTATYKYNILKDFGIEAGRSPRFLMVTGVADLRRGGQRFPLARAVVYIAEVTSGQLIAYGVPWDPARQANATPLNATFVRLDGGKFRAAAIRGG